MRITEAGLHPLRLEFVRPLKTARATYAAREGFVVRLRDESGRSRAGRGDAVAGVRHGVAGRLRAGPA